MKSLYVDFISTESASKFRYCSKGEVISDTAVAVSADAPENFANDAKYFSEGDLRTVEITGADGKKYTFAANFGKDEILWNNHTIPAYSSILIAD